MKIRRKDGTEEEVPDDTKLEEGEEKVSEPPKEGEEEKELKKIEALIGNKIQKALKEIYANPVNRSPQYHKAEATIEKSVMETDPFLRMRRPFVKLSDKMEDFVTSIKIGTRKDVTKTLAEDDDTAGGFLVPPPEFIAEVVRYTTEMAIVRPRARVFSMARDQLTLPKLDQSSANFGGAESYWAEESAAKTESTPAFGRITLKVKKLIGLCYSSDELLADSAVNIANYLVSLFGEVIAYEEDYRFLRGTGMTQPLGIISTTGINVATRTTSSKIGFEDIIAMYVAHPAWADANAVWLTTKAGMGELMNVGYKTTGGITLVIANLRDKPALILQGKEVILTEKLPALGTKGDIVLADLGYYYIGDRGGLAVASSIHERFTYDETTFRFVKRVDGQPAIASAFTVLNR